MNFPIASSQSQGEAKRQQRRTLAVKKYESLRPLRRLHLHVAGKHRCHGFSLCSCSAQPRRCRQLRRPAGGSLSLSGPASCYVGLKPHHVQVGWGVAKRGGEVEVFVGGRGDLGKIEGRKMRSCEPKRRNFVFAATQKSECCFSSAEPGWLRESCFCIASAHAACSATCVCGSVFILFF